MDYKIFIDNYLASLNKHLDKYLSEMIKKVAFENDGFVISDDANIYEFIQFNKGRYILLNKHDIDGCTYGLTVDGVLKAELKYTIESISQDNYTLTVKILKPVYY